LSATPSRADLGRIVMVMPTYNESLNLEWIVGRSEPPSRTSTSSSSTTVARRHRPDRRRARRRRPAREGRAPDAEGGLGAAYRAGFRVALDAGTT
jgi:dolichol-phosphate mannosyltransferase